MAPVSWARFFWPRFSGSQRTNPGKEITCRCFGAIIYEGRSPDQLKALLNATHSALVAAFRIPERDRYQIVHEHSTSHLVVDDTGLGIPPTKNYVLLQITTRPRERRAKEAFYHLLCESLKKECDIGPSHVVVTVVTNSDED